MIPIYVLVFVLHITPTAHVTQQEVGIYWTRDECVINQWTKEAERRAKVPVQDGHYYCKSVWRFRDAK